MKAYDALVTYLENWKYRHFFPIVLFGLPFAIYKALFGYVALTSHYELIGFIALAWGSMDFMLNIYHGCLDEDKRLYCVISVIGDHFGQKELFFAFDAMLAFLVICFMLWSGWIVLLGPFYGKVWLIATTINLLGV